MVDPRKKHTAAGTNAREAAFSAVLISIKNQTYVVDHLEKWRNQLEPSIADFHLAREIAYGSVRMALALDYLAIQLTEQKKLNVKIAERVLMRTALYQACYMDRIPIYAIVNETIAIAKKHFHPSSVKFINAILRKLSKDIPQLPQGSNIKDLSIRYSYPEFFVGELIKDYGMKKGQEIMEEGNLPSQTMFRVRSNPKTSFETLEGIEFLKDAPIKIGVLKNGSVLSAISGSQDCYIQNATPACLIHHLCQHVRAPKKILDLCASPGGKIIAVHDYFPQAELAANDISEQKLSMIAENCGKYSIQAALSLCRGESFKSAEPFDIVIVDAPCSNSGVLNKRVEARWRLSAQSLKELESLQLALLENASKLIKEGGEIWYMTCSILKGENEFLASKAAQLFSLQIKFQETILPNREGWDGGFACKLSSLHT